MDNQLTTGVKITVDSSDLDVKFLKSVDELNAGLTKTQKALRLTYDENGLLTNAFGQCVEGLNTSQIKLGEYVDELGRVRTIQGGFTEGLNKSQIAMGQYADELGNIYNKYGDLIGQTAQATRRIEQQANAAAKANDQLKISESSFEGVSTAAQQTAGSIGSIAEDLLGANNPITTTADEVTQLSKVVLDLGTNFNKLKETKKTLKEMPVIMQNTGKYAHAVVASMGRIFSVMGPGVLVVGAFAVALLTLKKYSEHLRQLDVPKEFENIAKNARKAHSEVKTLGDALNFGAFNKGSKSEVAEALEELERLQKKGITAEEQAEVDAFKSKKNAIGNFIAWYSEVTSKYLDHPVDWFGGDHTFKEQQKAMGKIDSYIAGIKEARKTEEDRLNEKIEDLQKILKNDTLTNEQRADLEKEVQTTQKEIREKAKQALESKIGVSIDPIPTVAENFKKSLVELNNAYSQGIVSEEQRQNAEKELTTKYLDAIKGNLNAEKIVEAQKELADAYKEGRINQNAYEEAQKRIAEYEAEVANVKKQELEAAREKLAQEIGVDLQELTKAQKESVDIEKRLNEAVKKQTITQEEKTKWLEIAKENDRKAALRETENSMGVSFETKNAADELKDNQKKLSDMLTQELIDNEQYNNALKQLNQAAQDTIPGLRELLEEEKKELSAKEKLAEAEKKIAYALEKGAITQEEANKATARAREAQEQAAKAEEEEAKRPLLNSIDSLVERAKAIEEATKTPTEKLKEEFEGITKAYKEGRITAEEYAKAQEAETKLLEDAQKKEEEEAQKKAENEKNKDRQDIGIDSLLEEMKTPLQKYNEMMDKITQAAMNGSITNEERLIAEEKAASVYWETMTKAGETAEKANEAAGKFQVAQSMGRGSVSLYTAQIENSTKNYQNRMQATTDNMLRTGQEMLLCMQQTTGYLSNMQNMSVWG